MIAQRQIETKGSQETRAMQSGLVLQRKCACGNQSTGCACSGREKGQELLRRPALGSATDHVPSIVYDVLDSAGEALDQQTRADFETHFGQDFSHVRVHADARAAESARAVNALAYTVGRDIVFAAGRYEPASPAGLKLLAHELTHTVQQGDGASVRGGREITMGAPDSAHEHEAAAAEHGLGLSQPRAVAGPTLQRKTWDTLPVYYERPEIIAGKSCPVSAKGTLSEVSWGETSGLYPTKDHKFDPSQWDAAKTCELLAARGAVHEVATRGQKVHKAKPGNGAIEKKLKPYHFVENFPALASEISNVNVKWFYLSTKSSLTTHPTISGLTSVKTYGPFYNTGGGDVAAGNVYIHFYRKTP